MFSMIYFIFNDCLIKVNMAELEVNELTSKTYINSSIKYL